MSDALRMLGLALRAGRLEAGEDPAGQACRERRCRLLVTARDAAGNTRRRAERFAREGRCLLLELPWSKEELGAALGRPSCAMAAVTDLGLARAAVEKLAETDPARCASVLERLERKAERAARRRAKPRPPKKERSRGKDVPGAK